MAMPAKELTDDEKMHIREVFEEDVVPRLMRMHARNGNINCAFAGEQFENWVIRFKSTRYGFDITDFEYDEDARAIDLAPKLFTKLTS